MNNNQKVLMKIRGYFDAFIQAERYISSVILIIVTLVLNRNAVALAQSLHS